MVITITSYWIFRRKYRFKRFHQRVGVHFGIIFCSLGALSLISYFQRNFLEESFFTKEVGYFIYPYTALTMNSPGNFILRTYFKSNTNFKLKRILLTIDESTRIVALKNYYNREKICKNTTEGISKNGRLLCLQKLLTKINQLDSTGAATYIVASAINSLEAEKEKNRFLTKTSFAFIHNFNDESDSLAFRYQRKISANLKEESLLRSYFLLKKFELENSKSLSSSINAQYEFLGIKSNLNRTIANTKDSNLTSVSYMEILSKFKDFLIISDGQSLSQDKMMNSHTLNIVHNRLKKNFQSEVKKVQACRNLRIKNVDCEIFGI